MSKNEYKLLNKTINEVEEAIEQYETLNDHWINALYEDKDYTLLVSALIPLVNLQKINENLQQLSVMNNKEVTNNENR